MCSSCGVFVLEAGTGSRDSLWIRPWLSRPMFRTFLSLIADPSLLMIVRSMRITALNGAFATGVTKMSCALAPTLLKASRAIAYTASRKGREDMRPSQEVIAREYHNLTGQAGLRRMGSQLM